MMIKRSPGGDPAGGGQSTSKSTCEVPAWTALTAFGDRSMHPACPNLAPAWTLTSEFDRINWPLTPEMIPFGICTRVLQWTCLKAVLLSTFVLGVLRGFTATSDLVAVFHTSADLLCKKSYKSSSLLGYFNCFLSDHTVGCCNISFSCLSQIRREKFCFSSNVFIFLLYFFAWLQLFDATFGQLFTLRPPIFFLF